MYTHILLPTDGSDLSQAAAKAGVALAAAIGAKVTGFHVKTPLPPRERLDRWEVDDPGLLRRLEELAEQRATEYLSVIEAAAAERAVPCSSASVVGDAPFEEIVRFAEQNACDLIFMASHGRGGMARFLLGSETAKVITHSDIPVLVHREKARRKGVRTR